MTTEQIKLECLRMAHREGAPHGETLRAARDYLLFVTGSDTAGEIKAGKQSTRIECSGAGG